MEKIPLCFIIKWKDIHLCFIDVKESLTVIVKMKSNWLGG